MTDSTTDDVAALMRQAEALCTLIEDEEMLSFQAAYTALQSTIGDVHELGPELRELAQRVAECTAQASHTARLASMLERDIRKMQMDLVDAISLCHRAISEQREMLYTQQCKRTKIAKEIAEIRERDGVAGVLRRVEEMAVKGGE